MRFSEFGLPVAGPNDTFDVVTRAWGVFTPYDAMIDEDMDGETFIGGTVTDGHGSVRAFDGFEYVDDARTFCVEVLGIPTERVRVIQG